MQLPVTLELSPSRTLTIALVLAHGTVAWGAVLIGLSLPVLLIAGALLAFSLAFGLQRSVFRLPALALTLETDGTLEALGRDGFPHVALVDPQTAVFPWLVVLLLRIDGRKVALALPPDALGSEGHRRLRLWLRWKASATAA